jgi:hypothetical protein
MHSIKYFRPTNSILEKSLFCIFGRVIGIEPDHEWREHFRPGMENHNAPLKNHFAILRSHIVTLKNDCVTYENHIAIRKNRIATQMNSIARPESHIATIKNRIAILRNHFVSGTGRRAACTCDCTMLICHPGVSQDHPLWNTFKFFITKM